MIRIEYEQSEDVKKLPLREGNFLLETIKLINYFNENVSNKTGLEKSFIKVFKPNSNMIFRLKPSQNELKFKFTNELLEIELPTNMIEKAISDNISKLETEEIEKFTLPIAKNEILIAFHINNSQNSYKLIEDKLNEELNYNGFIESFNVRGLPFTILKLLLFKNGITNDRIKTHNNIFLVDDKLIGIQNFSITRNSYFSTVMLLMDGKNKEFYNDEILDFYKNRMEEENYFDDISGLINILNLSKDEIEKQYLYLLREVVKAIS